MKEILGRIVAAELEERRKQGYDVEALRPLLGRRQAAVTRCWRFHSVSKRRPYGRIGRTRSRTTWKA